jgi:GntR family transcriptional regulator/MocR family aminotransferase
MTAAFPITLDRSVGPSLTLQIAEAIRAAIEEGRLAAGARLPSWRDLAAQLGVARGTVRAAYERLSDEQLIVGQGAAGTRVAQRPPRTRSTAPAQDRSPLPAFFRDFESHPLPFQMGVPAEDAFPYAHWSRQVARAARAAAAAPVGYPDPRGLPQLRREISAYLALARGIACTPGQVIITAGFASALNLVIRALSLEGRRAWFEEPGFPLTRAALELSGVSPLPVPVDGDGIDVEAGQRLAPDASLAIVTPGQQAPTGVTLSLARRLALLEWARQTGGWIVEDDYLGELQLKGRAAPALASLDQSGRVLHIGTFSKTITPGLRLGFLVVPLSLAEHFGTVAACLSPAPAPVLQRAVADFIAEGHFLRHLRRMKRLYAARRDALLTALRETAPAGCGVRLGGLALLLDLPEGTDDLDIVRRAVLHGLSPVPLSPWRSTSHRPGLMLGVTNVPVERAKELCKRLAALIQ